MSKIFTTLLLTLWLSVGTVWAGDYEDGLAAAKKQDYVTAIKKFQIAAEKGNARAQFMLGFMYEEGIGVKQDYAEAMRWYKLAAAQGEVDPGFKTKI